MQVRDGSRGCWLSMGKTSQHENFLVLRTRVLPWCLQELLTLMLLVVLRLRLGRCWWDVVNVHIAYPLLRFPHIVRWLFGKQIVVTEHWSAYHNGFYLPAKNKARRRIERIFHHGIPLITVSHALMDDIIRFADTDAFTRFVVPNVVDPTLFYPMSRVKEQSCSVFLMVASWAPIKRPFLAMEAFAGLLGEFPDMRLRIVGGGKQFPDMEAYVKRHNLGEKIKLLGPMSKKDIAEEMRCADCFLHASEYETFSVVCAEALCCGIPVIASNVGGIPEFVNVSNGKLIENSLEAWTTTLREFVHGELLWDRKGISVKATAMFNSDVVGKKLAEIYSHVSVLGQP